MSLGPTQQLFQRAKNWAGDVEELSTLQWQLFRLEWRALRGDLRRSSQLFGASLCFAALGIPLAIVAGLVMLAQGMDWPVANVLACAGVCIVFVAAALGFAARRSWATHAWFPRSRSQAQQNVQSIFAQLKSTEDDAYGTTDEYDPD